MRTACTVWRQKGCTRLWEEPCRKWEKAPHVYRQGISTCTGNLIEFGETPAKPYFLWAHARWLTRVIERCKHRVKTSLVLSQIHLLAALELRVFIFLNIAIEIKQLPKKKQRKPNGHHVTFPSFSSQLRISQGLISWNKSILKYFTTCTSCRLIRSSFSWLLRSSFLRFCLPISCLVR